MKDHDVRAAIALYRARDGASDLNTELVDKGGALGLHDAGELDKPKSVAGKTPGGYDDERDKAHECVHLIAQDGLVPAFLLLGASGLGKQQTIRAERGEEHQTRWKQVWGGR